MALTYGFYNSINHDRVYSAEEMAGFLDGIIFDGVYQAVGENFMVEPMGGMSVSVGSGRAWFDHTWTLNTTKYRLTLDEAYPMNDYNRIDAVILEVNKTDRKSYLKVIKGEPSLSPVKPILERGYYINQYALAYVTVRGGSSEIIQEDIDYVVGRPSGSASPWSINESYEQGDLVSAYSGHIYEALRFVPAGTDVSNTAYWQLVQPAETPLVSGLSLSGIPSGGKIGYVLAKSSDESGAVGWYHPDHLPYADWMYPSGISIDDVVAAFKFKGAESELTALVNCDHGSNNFTLLKSANNVSWSMGNGILITGSQSGSGAQGYLTCEDLMNSDFKTVAVKFSGVNLNGVSNADCVVPLVSKCFKNGSGNYVANDRITLYARCGTGSTTPVSQGYTDYSDYSQYPGVFWHNENNSNNRGFMDSASAPYYLTEGVLSCYTYKSNDSKTIFYNGNMLPTSTFTYRGAGIVGDPVITNSSAILIGDFPASKAGIYNHGNVYIEAIIFFSRKLNSSEIARVHEAMLLL